MTRAHEPVKNGQTFYYDGYKYHVVSSLKDKDTDTIIYVVKYFGKHKRWWHYEAWTAFEYDLRVRKLY